MAAACGTRIRRESVDSAMEAELEEEAAEEEEEEEEEEEAAAEAVVTADAPFI